MNRRLGLSLGLAVIVALALGCGGDASDDEGSAPVRTSPPTRESTPDSTHAPGATAVSVTATAAPPSTTPIAALTATPPASNRSGAIDGIVLVGPQCPVMREDEPCPDAPLEATIVALNSSSREVARTRSGTDGRFTMTLPAGLYTLVPERFETFPSSSEQQVTVIAGASIAVTIPYDSGIR